jgi:hypothetical protein
MDAFQRLIDGFATNSIALEAKGRVENSFRAPFSVPIMDAGFDFNKIAILETKKFVRDVLGIEEELHRIIILSTLNVQLDRQIDRSRSNSDSNLSVIRDENGKLIAVHLSLKREVN